ncbi:hypothetical protein [Photorhabdus luminescens]|uniref:CopG family transcriptional regulator n=1 Tax=Photorhabdus luminescens subsp. sonorensis TaxID=1173677 RepID=A0A5C4RMZ8_PHOLU|nr:hypothetical protein [Photorhabdus luminescens]TNH45031.1 hypothetical protein EP164_02635 [Photorhabdus luminescens subsp. sonorensis]
MTVVTRVNIDLPEEMIRALEILKERFPDKSCVEHIRKAVDAYLETNILEHSNSAFGLWKDKKLDGSEYQNSLREEWQ